MDKDQVLRSGLFSALISIRRKFLSVGVVVVGKTESLDNIMSILRGGFHFGKMKS